MKRSAVTQAVLHAVILALALLGRPAPCLAGELAQRIDAIVDAPEFRHAQWGVLVADMQSGATIYERAAEKLFAPASTTKLYSVAAALDALGADHRFETPIFARGKADEAGRLQGDLILVASGDLNMGGRCDAQGRIAFVDNDHTYADFSRSAELTATDPLAGIDELARQVATKIKHITGDVIIDDRLFDSARGTGSGPGRLTPIIVNDNLIDVRITPTKPGQPATIEWRPQTAAVQVDARVTTAAADAKTHVELTSLKQGTIVVRGQIATKAKPLVRIHEMPDAASFARTLLIEALHRAGVSVDASLLDENDRDELPADRDYAGLDRVAVLKSLPFSEAIRLVLKVSHNLHASTLPLLLAAHHGERTLAAGLKRQHEFLARAGVPVDTISFGGGAGGDRADYVTPRATVQLLRYMATRPDFEHYRQALPILGVDGTLATSVGTSSPARGKMQAKTGTLVAANVMNSSFLLTKALAGYGTTAAGKPVVFAMFVNQLQVPSQEDRERIGQLLGKLCETVYECP